MLRSILQDHSIHRPPYSIFIFERYEIEEIIDFALQSFLRHFSLYELAFKPRVEIELRTDPVLYQSFGGPQPKLDDLEPMELEDAEKIAFLIGLKDSDPEEAARLLEMRSRPISAEDEAVISDTHNDSQANIADQGEKIDWKRVGKVY